jgi:hypothetical protein
MSEPEPTSADAPAPAPAPAVPAAAASTAPPPSQDELNKAFKAFKKRLKLTQLDFDSRIGASPLSGHASGIVAIAPPREFSREVWDALVAQGKLKRSGQGQYELKK